MLVYANYLTLQGAGAAEVTFRAVGGWLKEQLGSGLHPEQLKREGKFEGKRGTAKSWLNIYATAKETPELYAWVLKNNDENVQGRQWVTELGLKISEDMLGISCVVRTDEQSTLIAEPVSASQPRVIRYLVNSIKAAENVDFATSVPGLLLKTVGQDSDSYRGLLADIEHQNRDYPIVLVSCTTGGEYLIEADRLQETLFGLAQVVQVSSEFNSYEMEEMLGRPWSAWNGAVNILYPPMQTGFVRSRLFLYGEIETWGDTLHSRISKILAWVTNNTNIPRLRRRIRPEGVVQLAKRRHLQAVHAKIAEMDTEQLRQELDSVHRSMQEQDEWIELFQQEYDQLEEEKAELKNAFDDTDSALRTKEHEIQSLKNQLTNTGAGRSSSLDVENLISLVCRNDQPTPLECLEVVQSVHGDKCTILDSAKKSARDMNHFVHGRRLLDMLIRLATIYRTELMNSGDSQARKCFGKNEFAATESETVVRNKSMTRARTFEYKGEQIQMLRHLKIGVDDDETKTIRVHFHWDVDKKRIVIGYCGVHLPVASR